MTRGQRRRGNRVESSSNEPAAVTSVLDTIQEYQSRNMSSPSLSLPTSVLGKRGRANGDDPDNQDSSEEGEDEAQGDSAGLSADLTGAAATSNSTSAAVNENIRTYARNWASRNDLSETQMREVDTFLRVSS